MARLTFLTCHLSGTGHLVRTLTLARTAREAGYDVQVLNGGRALDHIAPDPDLVQLPPVTIRGLEFGTLRRPDGELAGNEYMAQRRAAIEQAMTVSPPDALITELYPFGRRILAGEFGSAIQAARNRHGANVVCSVRDIPEPKPKRLAEVADRLRRDFDAVLVHGDPAIIPLSDTWPLPGDLPPVHATGYIGRPIPGAVRGETVLVSCGGGVLGRDLAALAVRAAARSKRRWQVLVGGADADRVVSDLTVGSPENARIETARPDFPALLAGAACSISLCGYNTAVDLLQCRTPAILVPSTEGGEQEQSLRAKAFQRLPGFVAAGDALPDADWLAAQADALADGPPRDAAPVTVDQGQRAVAVLERMLHNRTP